VSKFRPVPRSRGDRFLRNDQPGSAELADILRSGPVRATLDKLMRAAAEATGIDYMVLGLRHHDTYEFIATFGVPLTGYLDRVPSGRMSPRLFDREVEVRDLQKEPNFVTLDIVPEAKLWRYGVNAPVKLIRPLTDDGVLAISGASRKLMRTGGDTLAQIRRYADIVADLVWLTVQIRGPNAHRQTTELVTNVLMSSIGHSPFAAALIDHDLRVLGFSPRFIAEQKKRAGSEPVPGKSIKDPWLDEAMAAMVEKSFETGKPIIAQPITGPDGEDLQFDFHRLSYSDVPMEFGIIGFYRRWRGGGTVKPRVAANDAAGEMALDGDGVGPVSHFLLSTLARKQRLLTRGKQSYLALRSWRKAIKPHQLAALKALKSDPPIGFVDQLASEMVEVIRATYGKVDHAKVVAVPCGHSGPDCLAAQLGRRVASILEIECVEAFICQPHKGSSHPKANVKRPPMKRGPGEVGGAVILIDDVATSGAHIAEAVKLLSDASAVWPVVWIAD
jgi:hypothetical protein